LSEEGEALAREIIGTDCNAEMQELARRIAEVHNDLNRCATHVINYPDYESEAMQRKY
jgi:hypothetical protein